MPAELQTLWSGKVFLQSCLNMVSGTICTICAEVQCNIKQANEIEQWIVKWKDSETPVDYAAGISIII